MKNKIEFQPGETAKKAVEKYVVTEGENIGRLKSDSPESEAFVRRLADEEEFERTDEVNFIATGGLSSEDINNAFDLGVEGVVGDEAAREKRIEATELFGKKPQYREPDNKRSGYTKELLDEKKELLNQANNISDEAKKYYGQIRAEQDRLAEKK